MGKSTINGHFQLQTVSSPEGTADFNTVISCLSQNLLMAGTQRPKTWIKSFPNGQPMTGSGLDYVKRLLHGSADLQKSSHILQ